MFDPGSARFSAQSDYAAEALRVASRLWRPTRHGRLTPLKKSAVLQPMGQRRPSKEIRTFGEKFECTACGRCCTRWTITVDVAKAARIRRHNWSHLEGKDPFVPISGQGDPYRLRMVGGRCVFLREDNHCRIHAELGYEEKPETCKAFPLHLTEINAVTYARLSFYCPAVVANEGPPLSSQKKWLQATRRGAGDIGRTGPTVLMEHQPLSHEDLDRIEAQIVSWMKETAYPMADRIAAGSGLLGALVKRARKKGEPAVARTLEWAEKEGLPSMGKAGRLGGSSAEAGSILSLLLGLDTASTGKPARLGQFFRVRLASLGLCSLYSGSMGAAASWKRIRRVSPFLKEPEDTLLTRYLLSKVQSRRYLAGNLSMVSGINLVAVGFAVSMTLSRLRAASENRQSVDTRDMELAVQASDLLVFEHSGILQSPVYAGFIESLLASEELCGSLLKRLQL